MTAQHTPGPWKPKQLGGYENPGWVILYSDKGGTHMRRLDYQGNFTEPDARRIAAAPELLEALVSLRAAFISHTQWRGDLPVEILRADHAIAKATEETP